MIIKLLGFKVRKNSKDGKHYVDIHYMTKNQLKGTDGCIGGGFEVGRDNFLYDPAVPLQINSEYELIGSVREFKGDKFWRCTGIRLVKN